MSLDAFISGKSSINASGSHAPNVSQNDQLRITQNKLDWQTRSSTSLCGGDDSVSTAANNEEDGTANDIVLAERTSNLISSYRDFISGREDEEAMMPGIGSRAGGRAPAASASFLPRSPARRGSRPPSIGSGDDGDYPLMRDWSGANHTTSRCELELEELRRHDGDGYSCDKKYRYGHPIYRSRQFKRFAAAVTVLCAIIGAAVMAGRRSGDAKADNFPDWEEQMEEALEEEDKKELPHLNIGLGFVSDENEEVAVPSFDVEDESKGGKPSPEENHQVEEEPSSKNIDSKNNKESEASFMINEVLGESDEESKLKGTEEPATVKSKPASSAVAAASGIESITRNILCCSSNPSTSVAAKLTSSVNIEQTSLSANQAALEYANAESHHPRWYDRSSGWTGTTYTEALDFCSNLGADGHAANKHELCPYSVYCPTGPHHIPLGGYKEEGTSRAPVLGVENGWVQVGQENVCVEYTLLEDESGSMADTLILDVITKVEGERAEDGEDAAAVNQHENENGSGTSAATAFKNEINQQLDEPAAATAQAPLVIATEQHAPSTPSKNSATTNPLNLTNLLHNKFKPLWLTHSDGWTGGSHTEAATFCTSIRGKKLCPYSAMCPHGPHHGVMGGRRSLEYSVEGEQYAPVLGGENHWVMIGNVRNGDGSVSATCMTHRQLEGRAPAWGLNEERSDLKQHVMCCTID